MSKEKSDVWKYFQVSVVDNSKAICNNCGTSLSRGGQIAKEFGTTNLKNHLRRKHPQVFCNNEAKSREGSAAGSSVSEVAKPM